MLLLPKKTRDEIVMILKNQIAPSETGFNLIQIAKALESLKEQETQIDKLTEDKKEEKK